MLESAPDLLAPARGPFALSDDDAFRRWRDLKLRAAPMHAAEMVVEIGDPRRLTASEHAALSQRLDRAGFAVYAGPDDEAGKDVVRTLGRQFGLHRLDGHWLADDDAVSRITAGDGTRGAFIPYTTRTIHWHTDGYYNPPERRIWSLILHCVRSAALGGENALLDHEIAYLWMREHAPELVEALMADDAMTIPPRTDEHGIARPAQPGPVFHVDPAGCRLHMRYTARTRSILWRDDPLTLAAAGFLARLLASDSPHIHRLRLEPGMGLLCRNVLHDRGGYTDDPGKPRLLYRARYYDSISPLSPCGRGAGGEG